MENLLGNCQNGPKHPEVRGHRFVLTCTALLSPTPPEGSCGFRRPAPLRQSLTPVQFVIFSHDRIGLCEDIYKGANQELDNDSTPRRDDAMADYPQNGR